MIGFQTGVGLLNIYFCISQGMGRLENLGHLLSSGTVGVTHIQERGEWAETLWALGRIQTPPKIPNRSSIKAVVLDLQKHRIEAFAPPRPRSNEKALKMPQQNTFHTTGHEWPLVTASKLSFYFEFKGQWLSSAVCFLVSYWVFVEVFTCGYDMNLCHSSYFHRQNISFDVGKRYLGLSGKPNFQVRKVIHLANAFVQNTGTVHQIMFIGRAWLWPW